MSIRDQINEIKKCNHAGPSVASWDHITCNKCGMVKTDSQWGIAKNKWFKNLDEAKFYQQHGRLPETV